MNRVRIAINIALGLALFYGAIYLLQQDSYFLRERWRIPSPMGTLFAGTALYLLAAGLALMGAFAAAIAYGWISGKVAMPDAEDAIVHPAYKGTLLVRYWYLVLPALGCILLAFALGDTVANPSHQQVATPNAAIHSTNTQK